MTCRQFYIMISLFVITLKIQKLPCFISSVMGKDGFVMLLLYLAVEVLLVTLAMFIAKRTREKTYEFKDSIVLRVLKKVLLVAVATYFLMQGVLFYEAIQDLFAHILFENLPWTVFSVLLIALIFYLANSGLRNIALNFELYAFVILGSLLFIVIFGAARTDFSVVLPLQSIDFSNVISHALDFNFWFGDFFIILLLAREAKDVKYKWTILTYVISMLVVVLMFIEFEGIYLSYASMQPSLVSVLSEQSMLGVDIGRIDWFLILMSEIGTILSSGVCMFFAKKSLHLAFPKLKQGWVLAGLMAILYLLDILLLVDFRMKQLVFIDIIMYISLAIKVICLILGIILAVCARSAPQKLKTKSEELQSGTAKESQEQLKEFSDNKVSAKETEQPQNTTKKSKAKQLKGKVGI